MERITGKEVETMMEAYASVYKTEEQQTLSEGYGKDCVKKEKKTKHNCAKKVCSEQWGEGTCIPEQHTLLDDGTVTHYDVMFEHGVEKMVPVEELDILVTEMHEHAAMEGELVLENDEYEQIDENLLQLLTRNRTVYRRDPDTGEKIKVQQQRDPKNLDKYVDKKTSGTGDYGYRDKKPGEPGDGTWGNFVRRKGPQTGSGTTGGTPVQKPQQSPSSNLKPGSPNETKDGTKFERRLPTSAELRAAQQARKDAPKVLSRGEIENRAVKAGVGVSKGTVKDPKIAADAARKAELERIRSRASSQTQAGVRPTVASTADPKTPPAAPAAKPAAAAASAPVVKKKPAMGARNRMRMEEVDVFDTIKEYLIGEGATEEEALQQMLTLTDEQRTEIIEGSCGSKPKKKKKGGYGK